jgi:hypothetical protein
MPTAAIRQLRLTPEAPNFALDRVERPRDYVNLLLGGL